jgi:hypothetical protein
LARGRALQSGSATREVNEQQAEGREQQHFLADLRLSAGEILQDYEPGQVEREVSEVSAGAAAWTTAAAR